MTVTNMRDIPKGAPNPVRVKFMVGFNQGYRHARRGQQLPEIEKGLHSSPWQAGYPLGYVLGNKEVTNEQLAKKLEEGWLAYHGGNHGATLRGSLTA